MSKKSKTDELVGEALDNAREDRQKALSIFDKVKEALAYDPGDPNSLNSAMLIGDKVVSVLEQLTRSNEQIVRLAQIKERQESKDKSSETEKVSMEDILKYAQATESKENSGS